jgi:hypothetical protein
MDWDDLHPLAKLLRRYAFAYTAAHDFAVCREIMVEDYVLRMGEHEIKGRDENYIPATEKQYRQFPGLGFTVHELVLGEDRAALRFTEHGRSVLHGGYASWSGISLYRWDGDALAECRVEQDYYARREQQRSGVPDPVAAPGMDPWVIPAGQPDARTERTVRDWLARGGLSDAPIGKLDNERCAPPRRILLSRGETTVLDLFTAGNRAAFHVIHNGLYAGGLPNSDCHRGAEISVYATGIATVDGDSVDVVAVTDRLGADRRLDAARRRG